MTIEAPFTPRPDEPAATDVPSRVVTWPFAMVMATSFAFFVYLGMVMAVLPRFVEEDLGSGELGIGLTLVTFSVAAIAVRPVLGPIADRFGRRLLIFGGSALSAVAVLAMGLSTELWHVLVLRGVMGIGEAAAFVGATVLVADLSPPHRRAEAASYGSVAIYAGIGVGPTIGELVLGDDRFVVTFAIAGLFALTAAVIALGVPRHADRRVDGPVATAPMLHRAALWPGVTMACGIVALTAFVAFIPDHSRQVGLGGAAGLFLVYSAVNLVVRVAGARLPERVGERRMVTTALAALAASMTLLAAVPEAWALWLAAALLGIGMAFMYPSLLANVVDRVSPNERASALSTLTMFFEVGTIAGGVVLGAVGQAFDKQAAFAGGAVFALTGVLVLRQFVVPAPKVPVPHEAALISAPCTGN